MAKTKNTIRLGAVKMDKLKNNLASIAALIAAVVAIGGGFIKYGELQTKINHLEEASKTMDVVSIESVSANNENIKKNTNSISTLSLNSNKNSTNMEVLKKEIELLKLQIEELKAAADNPLTN